MSPRDALATLAAGVGRGVDRLIRRPPQRHRASVAAALLVGMAVLFVELHFGGFGHGTHLLVFLLLTVGIAFIAGPLPGAVALVVGAVGSAVMSLAGIGSIDSISEILAQVLLYIGAGGAYLALLAAAISSRRRTGIAPARSGDGPPALDRLTIRELESLRLAAGGMTVEEIGDRLFLSSNTVKTHLSHAYGKLGAHNRSDAIRAALECGCLSIDDICPHRGVEPTRNAPNG